METIKQYDETDENKNPTSKHFYELLEKAKKMDISDEEILQLPSYKLIKNDGKNWKERNFAILYAGYSILAFLFFPTIIYMSIYHETSIGYFLISNYIDLLEDGGENVTSISCLVPMTEQIQDLFRPPIDCSSCVDVKGIEVVTNLTYDQFMERYAYKMQPALVKDGQKDWSAKDVFSFDYFKSVYSPDSEALEKVQSDCQFFRYQTELKDLGAFFNMSADRVEGKEKPWYIGWSNCDGKAANELRKHYQRPYFLPKELDHSKIDWVFMGLPGYGAMMHIDFVGASSWQAQVKGIKKWTIEAPPECYGQCISQFEVIVSPGDIIVLDTDHWFHKTEILGTETSIVIGSEYY